MAVPSERCFECGCTATTGPRVSRSACLRPPARTITPQSAGAATSCSLLDGVLPALRRADRACACHPTARGRERARRLAAARHAARSAGRGAGHAARGERAIERVYAV